ncbi:MAG: alpha/beta hydrolase [Actinomycetota bacterium]|nr:alpha/beta hydrolase [Actinomycetota bacterium]
MASLQANGITIEYEEQGSGEPLLLIMGLGGQLIDWPQDFVDKLAAKGFRVIRFDNRDAGLSTEFTGKPPTTRQMAFAALTGRTPTAAYRLSDMATDAAALLDALNIEQAHVVGISMGGMIAQALTIDHPAKVRSLTSIMSMTGDRRHGKPKASLLVKGARLPEKTAATAHQVGVEMWRLISGPSFDPAEAARITDAAIARSFRPAGNGRQTAAILASPDRTAALQQVTVPTLVVHGMVDPLVQHSGGIATAKAVPNSRLLLFNDMGHDMPTHRRQEIVDAIAANAARAK